MTFSSLLKRLASYHQLVEKSNAATRRCNMFAWQINLCHLIIALVWTEQLHLCAKTYLPANVSRIFSHFFQMAGEQTREEIIYRLENATRGEDGREDNVDKPSMMRFWH